MQRLRVPVLLVMLAVALTALARPVPPAAVDYADEQNWLCRPGRSDACSTPTTGTIIDADGARHAVDYAVAADPAIDCFYVYPTVSHEPTPNADLRHTGVEEAAATAQFARFASQCRPFAPRYRQVTVAGLRAAFSGFGEQPDVDLAYNDVRDAWHNYLANDNHGRGVVLVGHSQGSKILVQLLAEEIDGKPLQAQLVSAIVPGALVEVPARKKLGGTFAHVPLCAVAADTGCVIAYSTYLAADSPPPRIRFGVPETANRVAACVDPASLANSTSLAAEFPARTFPDAGVTTTFVALTGSIHGECVTRGAQTVLVISALDEPKALSVPGTLAAIQGKLPGWGLHVLDINLALGNLVDLVGVQGRAWAAKHAVRSSAR
jgi:hypothetical protein